MGVACVAKSTSLSAQATTPEAVAKRTIQAKYDQISEALRRNYAATIIATRASGYQKIDSDGSIHVANKEAEAARITRITERNEPIEDKTTVQSIELIGEGVVVTVSHDYTRTQSVPSRGLVGKLHEVGTNRAFWVKAGNDWQLKQERILHRTITRSVNGKVRESQSY